MRSSYVEVTINLDQVRASAEAIRTRTGVRLIAVVKADAYGLGAPQVADALASVADEFAYFSIFEARAVRRPGLALGRPTAIPPSIASCTCAQPWRRRPRPADLPACASPLRWMRASSASAVHRKSWMTSPPFATVEDYFAHTVTLDAALRLRAACTGRGRPFHAAATDLLEQPETWFSAGAPRLCAISRRRACQCPA